MLYMVTLSWYIRNMCVQEVVKILITTSCTNTYIAHLRQQCYNSKLVIFQEKRLKVLKYCTFLWVQRRHKCSPAASFANCVMTLNLLKAHLQTFLSIPITQKCQFWVVTLLSQMSDISYSSTVSPYTQRINKDLRTNNCINILYFNIDFKIYLKLNILYTYFSL